MRIKAGNPDAYWAKVFFNGAPLSMCVMADEERGEVIVYVTDSAGRILINAATGDALTEAAHGSVSVFIAQCHADDGFDAWMRERVEAAHQAMMKHVRRGGISYEAKKSALRLAIPGTQVVLNSGGPVMTVIGMTYDGKAVACAWHVDGLAMGDSFPMECLRRCDVSQVE
ncbi:hypothetical protein CSQ90_26540 [Janthinobacterium sp. BJB303]|nr:hypothetical protein CSQ90_26540 [Janthinobacterium sp. BJB303]